MKEINKIGIETLENSTDELFISLQGAKYIEMEALISEGILMELMLLPKGLDRVIDC